MKRLFAIMILLALVSPAMSAPPKEDHEGPKKYEINIEIRFNSITMEQFAEIEKYLDSLKRKPCKLEIKKEMLPKDGGFIVYDGSPSITLRTDN